MTCKTRTCACCAAGLAVVLGLGTIIAYSALRHVPHFYEEALEAEPAKQEAANDSLIKSANALASTARQQGEWSAVFTADEINGWLAIDLPESFPGLLPEEISAPRVRLGPRQATIACRYHDGAVNTVISLNVELYLTEPNVLALRIRNIRAGAIPIPLSQVLDGVSAAAADMNLHLRWVQVSGDPVALVTIPANLGKDQIAYRLEKLDLRQDALYVAGVTQKQSADTVLWPGGAQVARGQASPQVSSQR